MSYFLPDLPFPKDALSPHMSAETLEFHHGKHHKTYVDTLNELIEGTEHENQNLLSILQSVREGKLYDQAAQHYNHSFFWHCLGPGGPNLPEGELKAAIDRDFGTFEQFQKEFTEKANALFGSGWTWLVKKADGKLQIVQEPNADCPLTEKLHPILTCDVWEHAYYIDYRNARPKYVDAYWNVVNWQFCARNFGEDRRPWVAEDVQQAAAARR